MDDLSAPPGRLRVRRAQPADAAAIAGVEVQTMRAAYRGLLPDDRLAGLDAPGLAAHWQLLAGTGAVLVAEDDGGIAGFVAFGSSRDPFCEPDTGEVYALYVLPTHGRRGAGRALLEAAAAELAARGYGRATLWVLEQNTPARRFYERAGWCVDGSDKTLGAPGDPVEVRYARPL